MLVLQWFPLFDQFFLQCAKPSPNVCVPTVRLHRIESPFNDGDVINDLPKNVLLFEQSVDVMVDGERQLMYRTNVQQFAAKIYFQGGYWHSPYFFYHVSVLGTQISRSKLSKKEEVSQSTTHQNQQAAFNTSEVSDVESSPEEKKQKKRMMKQKVILPCYGIGWKFNPKEKQPHLRSCKVAWNLRQPEYCAAAESFFQVIWEYAAEVLGPEQAAKLWHVLHKFPERRLMRNAMARFDGMLQVTCAVHT